MLIPVWVGNIFKEVHVPVFKTAATVSDVFPEIDIRILLAV